MVSSSMGRQAQQGLVLDHWPKSVQRFYGGPDLRNGNLFYGQKTFREGEKSMMAVRVSLIKAQLPTVWGVAESIIARIQGLTRLLIQPDSEPRTNSHLNPVPSQYHPDI